MMPFDPKTVDRRPKLGVRRPPFGRREFGALNELKSHAWSAEQQGAGPTRATGDYERFKEASEFIAQGQLWSRGMAPKRPALTAGVVRGLEVMVEVSGTIGHPEVRRAVHWIRHAAAWRKAYDSSRKAVTQ